MNEPKRDYKAKYPFWKRKPEEKGESSPRIQKEKNSFWTSWGGSLLIHIIAVLFLISAAQIHRPNENGLRGKPDGSVGILFFDEEKEPDAQSEDSETASQSPASPQNRTTEISPNSENEKDEPDPLIGVTEKKEPAAVAHIQFHNENSGIADENGKTGSQGKDSDASGHGQTVGFGRLNGKGKRFVYVLDRSDSMKYPENLPFQYAVQETLESIESLNPDDGAQKFQVILYNHHTSVFGNQKRLLDVTAANKEKAMRFIKEAKPEGGTDPLAALDTAIRMTPDVIFFLTDAEEEISPIILAKIQGMRRQGGVSQIHVIEFGNPRGKRLKSFQKLAQQNNGTYVYEDVTRLPK